MITLEYNTKTGETKHRQFVSWEFFEKFILDECDMINTLFPVIDSDLIKFELVIYNKNETYYINKIDDDNAIHYSNGKLTYGKIHVSERLYEFLDDLLINKEKKIDELKFA